MKNSINRCAPIITLIFGISLTTFGAVFQSGYIVYNKTSSTQISFAYHLMTNAADSNLLASDFTSTIKCDATGIPITISNIQKTISYKSYYDCQELDYNWNYTFEVSIDLSNAKYANLASCCNLMVDLTGASRENGITTLGDTSSNFYIYSSFKNCNIHTNKAPISNFNYNAINCLNKAFYLGQGNFDPIDYDSISYELTDPLSASGSFIPFITGLSKTLPHHAFFSSGTTHPFSNPKSVPPIGFHFDALNGDIIYTPVNTDEKGPVAFKIKEWRKDNTNTYVNIGTIHREILVQTNQCPNNNPPTIDGPYDYTAIENNSLCFDIFTNDLTFIPPPPGSIPPADSVKISWNRAIPTATFNVINPKALHQTGRFCWTPSTGSSSILPYTFTVTARDNSCPLNAVDVKTFKVLVKETATLENMGTMKLQLVPNPAATFIEINLDLPEVVVLNSIGIEVLTVKNARQININSLANGMYYLKGIDKNKVYYATFVKE